MLSSYTNNKYTLSTKNNMKQLLTTLLVLIAGICNSQQPCCFTCPQTSTVTLGINEIHDLHTNAIVVATPPPGYAVRLIKPVLMWVYSDGTGFIFSSGEILRIYNSANVLPILGEFSEPSITADGIYSAHSYFSYECMIGGDIKVMSTWPITSGGPASYIRIELTYDLVEL
jgi:hypothetical protein